MGKETSSVGYGKATMIIPINKGIDIGLRYLTINYLNKEINEIRNNGKCKLSSFI